MVRLIIDGIECTLRDQRVKLPTYDASKLRSVEAWRSGIELELEVCATANIEQLFGNAEEPYRYHNFNDTLHKGTLLIGGIPLIEGTTTYLGAELKDGKIYYRISLRSGGAEWAEQAAKRLLAKSQISYNYYMTLQDIEKSWSDDSAICFLPLRHDSYPKPVETTKYLVQQQMMPHEYHPFINICAIFDEVASTSRYELKSSFLNSEFAKKLMMSGAYHTLNRGTAQEAMGFKAIRTSDTKAVAAAGGWVDAWGPTSGSNLGGIVDSVSPTATDDQGVPISGAYSNNNCFTIEAQRPTFTPTRDISVAFEYHIRYTTQYRIASSTQLCGFDTLHLGNGCNVKLTLHNPHIDRRNDISPQTQYMLYVFNHEEGSKYMLTGIANDLDAECSVVTTRDAPRATQLYVKRAGNTKYNLFIGDWALYNGHVARDGKIAVELNVRTPYHRITPTSPMLFNDISFSGAIPDQEITLCKGCSIEPIFGGTTGFGERLSFEDIAQVEASQADIIMAVAQMFNLCIYSHEPSHTIIIEPYDTFFNGEIIDWRARQIDGPWRVEELRTSAFEHTTLAYAEGDGVMGRFANENGFTPGTYTYHIEGYGTKQGTKSIKNPIFAPTISLTYSSSSAPSAEILTVGDRDNTIEDGITPRIVLYNGLAPLPEGEKWYATANGDHYPHASFHSAKAGASLDFLDRDGHSGLHKYYDREMREMAERQTLQCGIRLQPDEYMSLLDPSTRGANIRSRFLLNCGNGTSHFTLQRIEEYDIATGVAKCTFRRTLND